MAVKPVTCLQLQIEGIEVLSGHCVSKPIVNGEHVPIPVRLKNDVAFLYSWEEEIMDHQTFAQLLGNYGELIGAFAVVATLGYLAVQIRQNTNTSKASGYRSIWRSAFWPLLPWANSGTCKLVEKMRNRRPVRRCQISD